MFWRLHYVYKYHVLHVLHGEIGAPRQRWYVPSQDRCGAIDFAFEQFIQDAWGSMAATVGGKEIATATPVQRRSLPPGFLREGHVECALGTRTPSRGPMSFVRIMLHRMRFMLLRYV